MLCTGRKEQVCQTVLRREAEWKTNLLNCEYNPAMGFISEIYGRNARKWESVLISKYSVTCLIRRIPVMYIWHAPAYLVVKKGFTPFEVQVTNESN